MPTVCNHRDINIDDVIRECSEIPSWGAGQNGEGEQKRFELPEGGQKRARGQNSLPN